ncbi:MAG: hypothetical protein IJT83_05950, partial [Victivallales bacterium]|nr:hypothetical protein [Victivallales bacterium]
RGGFTYPGFAPLALTQGYPLSRHSVAIAPLCGAFCPGDAAVSVFSPWKGATSRFGNNTA